MVLGLEKIVVDLRRFQIRRRATDEDLERYYDECMQNVRKHADLFEDQGAFERAVGICESSERARMSAKRPKRPGMFNFKNQRQVIEDLFNPDASTTGKYFYGLQIRIAIPYTIEPFSRLYDGDEVEKGTSQPSEDKRPLIEIPNDCPSGETKASLFHEALHYVLFMYQFESRRLFTDNAKKEFESKKEKRFVETFLQEDAVMYLTDVLLEDNRDALFEHRWSGEGMQHSPIMLFSGMAGSVGAVALIGFGIANPYLLALAPIPKVAEKVFQHFYKNSQKSRLIEHLPRPEHKI